jgi:hypothetical protein
MSSNPKDIATIERYLTHDMEQEERQQFEQLLASDEAFRQEVEGYRLIFRGFRLKRLEAIRQQVRDFEKTLPPLVLEEEKVPQVETGKVVPIMHSRRWMRWAAVACFALLAVGLFFLQNRYSDDSMVRRYAGKAPNVFEDRKVAIGIEEKFQAGVAAAKEGHFVVAVRLLDSIPPSFDRYGEARLMLSFCKLKTGAYQDVLDIANSQVDTTLNDEQEEDLNWYRTLASFGLKDEKSDTALDSILKDPSHRHFNDAQKIQQERHSFWRKLIW